MLVLNSKPSMVLSICPLTDYIYGSQMKTGFCGGAAVNFSKLQESLSFYRASKFTLYATEMHNSVYFLFIAPQSCVTSITKRGETSADCVCGLGLDEKYRMDLA